MRAVPGASGPMDCCVSAVPLGAAATHVFAEACSANTRLPSTAVTAPAQQACPQVHTHFVLWRQKVIVMDVSALALPLRRADV